MKTADQLADLGGYDTSAGRRTPKPPTPQRRHALMTEIDTLTLTTQELPAATTALGGGDEEVGRIAADLRALIASVTNASTRAAGEAASLHANDVMAPEGKARLLSELPSNLVSATAEPLAAADVQLDVIEGIHLERILHHDSRNDAALIAELGNYTVALKQEGAVAAMVGLAARPRYATILAGPMGDSLAARFGFDPSILRQTALQALAVNGSADQVKRSAALAAIPAARRVIGLAKGGRDQVADQVRRGPRRSASAVNALMP
jgi:hypothetical protein